MNTFRSTLLSLSLAAATLPAALAAQTAGNFDDHVVWDYSLRFTQDMEYVDDDGDGLRALYVAAPGSATFTRIDENGARTVVRGSTGVRFGHEFKVGAILPGGGYAAALASDTRGTHYLSFFHPDGTSAAPLAQMPGSIGFLIDVVLGNFDGDPEDEVGVVGTTGWGYYDMRTTSFRPVQTHAAGGSFSPVNLVRRMQNGTDRLWGTTSGTPREIREHDTQGNSTLVGTFPNDVAGIDAAAWLGADALFATNDGSFSLPHGSIYCYYARNSTLGPIVSGRPEDRISRLSTGGPLAREREWFFVRRPSGGVDSVEAMNGTSSIPREIIRSFANNPLDIADGGATDMFPGNTRHLVVRQAGTSRFSAYQVDRPVDLRLRGNGATTGGSVHADVSLGSTGAGADVYALLSVSGSGSLRLPGLGSISFMPDALTSASVAYLGGRKTADANGDCSFQMPVPGAPIGRIRLEISLGYVGIPSSGAVLFNQTGAFGYVDLQ